MFLSEMMYRWLGGSYNNVDISGMPDSWSDVKYRITGQLCVDIDEEMYVYIVHYVPAFVIIICCYKSA